MQGKLMTKSKVIQTRRPKSQVFRRRVKPERASTPQRWSRRIRSLPPIPINVLKPRRKNRNKCTRTRHERFTSTSSLQESKKRNIQQKLIREKRKNVFVNKKNSEEKADSVEVVRIVPVVVYVKNPSKQNKTFVPEEIRVHINDNPTCQMVSQAIDSHIHKKMQEEWSKVERRYSKRIKMSARSNQAQNVMHAAKRKFLSKKKMLLYN